MADFSAGSISGSTNYVPAAASTNGSSSGRDNGSGGDASALVTQYQMAWKDVDPGPSEVRIWVSIGNPDPTGASYTGPKNGSTPISGAIVVAYWTK